MKIVKRVYENCKETLRKFCVNFEDGTNFRKILKNEHFREGLKIFFKIGEKFREI